MSQDCGFICYDCKVNSPANGVWISPASAFVGAHLADEGRGFFCPFQTRSATLSPLTNLHGGTRLWEICERKRANVSQSVRSV
jgi:hypothetical protein